MSQKLKSNELWEHELWTQKEVANYFRVVQGTVKNWRDQGLLSYWQVPGSTRVLFYRDEIKKFIEKYTIAKKDDDTVRTEIKKEKPRVSFTEKEWRI